MASRATFNSKHTEKCLWLQNFIIKTNYSFQKKTEGVTWHRRFFSIAQWKLEWHLGKMLNAHHDLFSLLSGSPSHFVASCIFLLQPCIKTATVQHLFKCMCFYCFYAQIEKGCKNGFTKMHWCGKSEMYLYCLNSYHYRYFLLFHFLTIPFWDKYHILLT